MSGRTLSACAACVLSLVSVWSSQAQQTLGESHISVQDPAELTKDERVVGLFVDVVER